MVLVRLWNHNRIIFLDTISNEEIVEAFNWVINHDCHITVCPVVSLYQVRQAVQSENIPNESICFNVFNLNPRKWRVKVKVIYIKEFIGVCATHCKTHTQQYLYWSTLLVHLPIQWLSMFSWLFISRVPTNCTHNGRTGKRYIYTSLLDIMHNTH